MNGLTDKQKEYLYFIKKFIDKNKYSPSYREIGDHFLVCSGAAYLNVLCLIKKGYLDKENKKNRTIRIIKEL